MADTDYRPTPELFDMTGRVAVITGGGRGIGEGIALSFAEAGAAVVVAARRTEEIEQVAANIRDGGGRAIAVTTDVTDDEAVEALAAAAVDEFGSLTTWVNNAGGSPMRMPLSELPRDEWDRTIALNLTVGLRRLHGGGPAHGDRLDHQHLVGCWERPGAPQRSLRRGEGRRELAHVEPVGRARTEDPGERCGPGAIPTEIMLKAVGRTEDQLDQLLKEWRIPLRRLGTPQDIGATCLYLASDAASWVTGDILRVGGGALPR